MSCHPTTFCACAYLLAGVVCNGWQDVLKDIHQILCKGRMVIVETSAQLCLSRRLSNCLPGLAGVKRGGARQSAQSAALALHGGVAQSLL